MGEVNCRTTLSTPLCGGGTDKSKYLPPKVPDRNLVVPEQQYPFRRRSVRFYF
jgi:hypothetical protein